MRGQEACFCLTKAIGQRFRKNGPNGENHVPLVRLLTPCGNRVWLLTFQPPDVEDTIFGLCDLEIARPDLGYLRVSLSESYRMRGIGIEKDRNFRFDNPVSVCARIARESSSIEV